MRLTLASTIAVLTVWLPAAAHANLIVNGGFEDGVYSSTIDGQTANNVPVGWTPNYGYVTYGGYDGVTTTGAHSGSHALYLGNDPFFPLAGLSQSLATLNGATYLASFYISNVWTSGYCEFLMNGSPIVTVAATDPDSSALPFTTIFADGRTIVTSPTHRSDYTLESFSFVGSGADTLTLSAENTYSSYVIDDVSVTQAPEPAGWTVLLAACIGLAACGRTGMARGFGYVRP